MAQIKANFGQLSRFQLELLLFEADAFGEPDRITIIPSFTSLDIALVLCACRVPALAILGISWTSPSNTHHIYLFLKSRLWRFLLQYSFVNSEFCNGPIIMIRLRLSPGTGNRKSSKDDKRLRQGIDETHKIDVVGKQVCRKGRALCLNRMRCKLNFLGSY